MKFTHNGLIYSTLNEHQAEVSRNKNVRGDIVIPENVVYEGKEYAVTSLCLSAFEECTELTSIVLPASLGYIGESAFYNCTNLKSIIIPDSVTYIWDYAFWQCENLISVVLPGNLRHFERSAFLRCYNLISFTISPNSNMFCTVEGVLFTKDKTGILMYPSGLPANSYVVPNEVKTIACGAFGRCLNLESVILPESLTCIEEWAFSNCSALTSITVPDGVISILDGAFNECVSLTSITIPDGVTEIGYEVFYKCTGLTEFIVSPNNKSLCVVDGVLFSKDKTTLIKYPTGRLEPSYVIPDGVVNVVNQAFSYCEGLVSVTLPSSLKNFRNYAFGSCKNLCHIYCEFDEEPFFDNSIFADGPFNRIIHTRSECIDMVPFYANKRVQYV